MRWKHSLSQILACNWNTVCDIGLNGHQLKHLNLISRCHSPSLGGTLNECQDCKNSNYIYHSCRNRHCPSCGVSKTEDWIKRQQAYLINTSYYHVVFTLPCELNQICLFKPKVIYDLLFKASWKTLQVFANDHKYLGAKTGMTAVLHTWSQNMGLHPHLHCIVPGGGVTKSGKWKFSRSKGKYLFPAKAMAKVYKGIFIKELKKLAKLDVIKLSYDLKESLYKKRWVVYAKRPFATPVHVIEYLGRYTHKVAISNHRLIQFNSQNVTFKWKNYKQAAKLQVMTLDTHEFIRRLSMHILPHKFVRIRHFGILSFHGRAIIIPLIQNQQNYTPKSSGAYNLPAKVICCLNCSSLNIKSYPLLPTKSRSP